MSDGSFTVVPYGTSIEFDDVRDLFRLVLSLVPRKRTFEIFGSRIARLIKHYICVNVWRIATFTFFTFGFAYAGLRIFPPWRYRLHWTSRPRTIYQSLQHRLLWAPRPKGIPNLGNTCYMNSILQVFCWTPRLGQQLQSQLDTMKREQEERTIETPGSYIYQFLYMLPFYRKKEPEKSMTEALLDLICEVHGDGKKNDGIISRKFPEKILRRARQVNDQFEGHQQQDSFEMFNTIVSAIEDEMLALHPLQPEEECGKSETVQIMNACPVSQLFGGEFITVYCYDSCEHTDVVYQRFTSICVPVISPMKCRKEKVKEENEDKEIRNSEQGDKETTATKVSGVDDKEKEDQTQCKQQEYVDHSDFERPENINQNTVPNIIKDVAETNFGSFKEIPDNEPTELICSSSSHYDNAANNKPTENELNLLNNDLTESDHEESWKLTHIQVKELKPFDWKNEWPKTNTVTSRNLTETDPLQLDRQQEVEVPTGQIVRDLSFSTEKGSQFGTEHPKMTSFQNSSNGGIIRIDQKHSIKKTKKKGKFSNDLTKTNNTKMHINEYGELQSSRRNVSPEFESHISPQQYTEAEFKKEECVEEFVNVFSSNNDTEDEDNKSLTMVQQKSFLRSSSVTSEGSDVSTAEINSMQNKNGNDQQLFSSESDSSPERGLIGNKDVEKDSENAVTQNILNVNGPDLNSFDNNNLQTNVSGDHDNEVYHHNDLTGTSNDQDKIFLPPAVDEKQSDSSVLNADDQDQSTHLYPGAEGDPRNGYFENLSSNQNVNNVIFNPDTAPPVSEHDISGSQIEPGAVGDFSTEVYTTGSVSAPSTEGSCGSKIDDSNNISSDRDTKSVSGAETKEWDNNDEDTRVKCMEQTSQTPEAIVNTAGDEHQINVDSNTNLSTNSEKFIEGDNVNIQRKTFKTLKEPENPKTNLEDGLMEQVNVEDFSEEVLGCMKCSEEGLPVGKGLVHKRLMVVRPPAVLVLQINRFRQTMNGTLEKIQGQVSFPKILDLSPYCSGALKCHEDNTDEVTYHLYGVVAHNGTIEQGHYYSYVRTNQSRSSELHYHRFMKPMEDPENISINIHNFLKGEPLDKEAKAKPQGEDKWFYVTDSFVSSVKEDRVYNDANACILMYERIK